MTFHKSFIKQFEEWEILSFRQTSFLNFQVKNIFSSRNKNEIGNGVSRFRRMNKSDHWEKLLSHAVRPPVYFLCILQLSIKNFFFIFFLAAFHRYDRIYWINKSNNPTYQMIQVLHSKRQMKWSTKYMRRYAVKIFWHRQVANYNRNVYKFSPFLSLSFPIDKD